MGIDLHNLNLLAHAEDLGVCFDHTLAIGRQAVFVEPDDLAAFRRRRGLPAWPEADVSVGAQAVAATAGASSVAASAGLPAVAASAGAPVYFEPMLRHWFGAGRVDSVDASAYEQASVLHDMNRPWPVDGEAAALRGRCDAVLDFGCLEHVFDFPTAWRNVTALCRVGGHVLHALPANNLSGHGFYQFSPELFFNLYQPSRGFELRGLYFAMKAEPRCWWRVADPHRVRRRVNLCNGHEVYMLVLARKLHESGELPAPQQSDYALQTWVDDAPTAAANGSIGEAPPRRSRWSAPLASLGLLEVARRWRERAKAARGAALALPAPDYARVSLDTLIGRRPARS